jgi:protein-S-isoprenylcysteine O-methyltransferase Ste14
LVRREKMSKCRIRLILWLVLAGTSVVGGIVADLVVGTGPFPIVVRLLGVLGMVLAHFPLKRTGRLLRLLGEAEKWGCTTRLVTIDIYHCVRHPHHVAVGIFMTSLGLLIGYPWSFLLITITQWTWVLGFLFLVEEKELLEKFGEEYRGYRQQVPMLFPNPLCVLRVLSQPIEIPNG